MIRSNIIYLTGLVALSCFCGSSPAHASTQCQVSVERIWAGDGGSIWVLFRNGGAAVIAADDPNKAAITAFAMTAITTGKQLIVRYQADGVDCGTLGRSDVVGMYLLS